jgi:hypothetical protein
MSRRTTSSGKAKPKGRAKPRTAYQSYAALDWGRIRREYETTTASMGELCRRYGIRSDGTIRKRMKADGGWEKNVDAITQNLVQGAIAAEAGDELSPLFAGAQPPPVIDMRTADETTGAEVRRAAGRMVAIAGNIVRADEHAARHGLPRTSLAQSEKPKGKSRKPQNSDQAETAPEPPPEPAAAARSTDVPPQQESAGGRPGDDDFSPMREVPIPPEDFADAAAVRTASDLARLHVGAVRRQLLTAQRLRLVSDLVLARIFVAVGAPTAEEAGEARGALMFLNPERETLAGLLKATADVEERAAAMERRALAMDPRTGAAPPPPPEPPVPINAVSIEKLVVGVPEGVLMQLRTAAAQLAKLPPNQRPSAKAAELDAPDPTPEGETT